MEFDSGDTLNIYEFWNKDSTTNRMFNTDDHPVGARKDYVDTLYKVEQECQFGISVRRDGRDNDVNNVRMSDIWYNITAKN